MVNVELECWLMRQREKELRQAAERGLLRQSAKARARARTRPAPVTPLPRGTRLREGRT